MAKFQLTFRRCPVSPPFCWLFKPFSSHATYILILLGRITIVLPLLRTKRPFMNGIVAINDEVRRICCYSEHVLTRVLVGWLRRGGWGKSYLHVFALALVLRVERRDIYISYYFCSFYGLNMT